MIRFLYSRGPHLKSTKLVGHTYASFQKGDTYQQQADKRDGTGQHAAKPRPSGSGREAGAQQRGAPQEQECARARGLVKHCFPSLGWAAHLAADSNVVHPEVAARDFGGQWLLRVYNNEEPLAPLPPLLKRHLSHPLHAEAGKDSYQSRARPAEYRPMRKR
jgi:hypothetical protein